jgi:MtN3 and saliva related transmembrane protein
MDYITVLGFIAASLTTISGMPQAIRVIRTKHTKDLSLATFTILTFGILLWFVYGLLKKDVVLIFANSISLFVSGVTLYYKLKYK